MQSDFDKNLLDYFTDVEHLRGLFTEYVSASELPKTLIVIHGIGGVGKSSLLRVFRLQCKSAKIPIGIASGDDAKSVLDVITHWKEDLEAEGVKFASLNKTLKHYRATQAKVDENAKKTLGNSNRIADIAGKAASKTAEAAGGVLLGAVIGSTFPVLGTAIGGALGGVVSGMGTEALIDWLRGFLTKPDIELFLDPTKRLTTDFLEDLSNAAERKRVVLLLDTYEQMTVLEDWVGNLLQKIHPNILTVIAGRKLPDWNRIWPSWMINAWVEEIKPMSEDVMRQLIRRYYATMRGGEPAPMQVDAIIRFARGLPMVVTGAVQLWVKYGVEDFQSVKAEIVANLADRLLEGVPKSLVPVLEAAAAVRWFDQPILRTVMGQDDVRDVYNELRRFPFVRTRMEGLALHDSVREMIDTNLQIHDLERHRQLHERAAVYFEKRLQNTAEEDMERLSLERLYHHILADEKIGIQLFQETAEKLTHYRLVNSLQVLMNDFNTYLLKSENSQLWKQYYNAKLAWLSAWRDDDSQLFEMIGHHPKAEAKLRAYALCDLGQTLSSYYNLENDTVEKAKVIIEESRSFGIVDSHLYQNYFSQARIALFQGDWDKYKEQLEEAKQLIERQEDIYGLAYLYSEMMEQGGPHGAFKDYFAAREKGLATLSKLTSSHLPLKARLSRKWLRVWAFAGRYAEGEQIAKECLEIEARTHNNLSSNYTLRDLGWILGQQNKFDEAEECFNKSLSLTPKLGKSRNINEARVAGLRGFIYSRQGDYAKAEEFILRSLKVHEEESFYFPGSILEIYNWLGSIAEILQAFDQADAYYSKYKAWKKYGSNYFACGAITGLVRVKYAIRDFESMPSLVREAEQLAEQQEYNDHLASLQLTQGHLAWETEKRSEVLTFYQKALIYALRYNRLLLDEVLSGRPQGTPLQPIIPFCLERREDSRKVLALLLDWWRVGVNNIGIARPDTISLLSEGIPLVEGEKLAREREPGDGLPQKTVVEQIEAALET